jgi:hypothetical protein
MDATHVWRCSCGFSSPQSVMGAWNIVHCPQCGKVTGFGESDASGKTEITDIKLLARIRRLIVAEHAGYVRRGYGEIEHACIEPGCSCDFGACGPFRNPPVRCTSFETNVLPLDPELERDYWNHLNIGTAMEVRRCAWLSPSTGRKCRKEVRGRGRQYCEFHAEMSRKQTVREASRRYRDKAKVSPGVIKVPETASAGA